MKAFIGRFTWSDVFDMVTIATEKDFCTSWPRLNLFLSDSV